MKIKDQERNEFRRTALPFQTISRIKEGLNRLDLSVNLHTMRSSDKLWAVHMEIPDIRASVNGKGYTEELAIASAFAEAAERLSAGMESGIEIGPFRQLFGEKGNTLAKVTLYKYMEGYQWTHQGCIENVAKVEDFCARLNFSQSDFHNMKMNSELLRHWISGYSLVHDKEISIPILFTKWISSTNGLAAGNTIEEAIVHGCCEIFEREAMINFLRNDLDSEQHPIIDPNTIDNPIIKEQMTFFSNNNIDFIIRDIGSGLYPVYALLTYNKSIPKSQMGYSNIKCGSAFDSDEAIIRCFTERMQGTKFEFEERLGECPSNDPDKYMPMFFKGICPMNLDSHFDGEPKPYVSFSEKNIAMEIKNCIDIAKRLDTDIIVVDHTHPVIDFPVARVIMPGLSDFMKWWNPDSLTPTFVGNLQPEEDVYEKKLLQVLKSFFK